MGLWISRVEVQEQRIGAVRFPNTIHIDPRCCAPCRMSWRHTPNAKDPHFAPRLKSAQGSLRHS